MPHLNSRRRAWAALELRGNLRTWQEIADALDFKTADGARLAVARLRKRDALAVDEMRAESVDGMRVTRRMVFDQLEVAARDGDAELVARLAREIRASFDSEALRCGLNMPVRTEVDVRVDPGQVLTQWFSELKAGNRPALPADLAVLAAECEAVARGGSPRARDRPPSMGVG